MDKKDTVLFYTDAINMAVYRGLEKAELGELMLALFEYNNGKEKDKSDFSSDYLYDLYVEYKKKVDSNYSKYKSRKERNKRFYEKKKAEKLEKAEEELTCGHINEDAENTKETEEQEDTVYYPNNKNVDDYIRDNIDTIRTGETRYYIIHKIDDDIKDMSKSVKIYDDIISKLDD